MMDDLNFANIQKKFRRRPWYIENIAKKVKKLCIISSAETFS